LTEIPKHIELLFSKYAISVISAIILSLPYMYDILLC